MSEITDKSKGSEQAPQPVNLLAILSRRDRSAICKARVGIDSSLKLLRRIASEGQDISTSLVRMEKGNLTVERTKDYILLCLAKISFEMDAFNSVINKIKTFFPSIDCTLLDGSLAKRVNELKESVDALENLERSKILMVDGCARLVQYHSLETRKFFKNVLRSIRGQTGGWWGDVDDFSDDEDSGKVGGKVGGSDETNPNQGGCEPPNKMRKTEDRPVEEDTNLNLNTPSASQNVNDE